MLGSDDFYLNLKEKLRLYSLHFDMLFSWNLAYIWICNVAKISYYINKLHNDWIAVFVITRFRKDFYFRPFSRYLIRTLKQIPNFIFVQIYLAQQRYFYFSFL